MKKTVFFLYIISSFCFASCKKDDSGDMKGPVSKDQAIKLCKEYIDAADAAVVLDDIMPPNTELNYYWYTLVSPNYSSWVIMTTPNVYLDGVRIHWVIFVNVETGELEIIKDSIINLDNFKYTLLKTIKTSSSIRNTSSRHNNLISTKTSNTSGLCNYAVIISGGFEAKQNYVRYYNNCNFLYNTLISEYNISKSNIKLLFANGSSNSLNMNTATYDHPQYADYPLDFDGDGLCDIDYSATSSNLYSVFASLSNTLTEGDNLFIFVTDHGDRLYDTSYICLWGENISSYSFASLVDMIPSSVKIQILLGQCYSGGFVSDLSANNRVIATACSAYEGALATSDYSTFLKEFTSALAEQTPTGSSVQSDVDGFYGVSFKEAYDWAYGRRPEGNTPQYNSTPSDFGDTYNIIGEDVVPPVLSGPDYMLYPSSGNFMVTGRHSDDSAVSWTCTGYQHAVSTSDSTATMPSTFSTIPYNRLQITANITTFRGLNSLSKWFTIWRGGTFNYIYNVTSGTGQCIIQDDGHSFTLLDHNTEMTGFTWYTDCDAIEIDFDGYYFADYSVIDEISYPFSVTCSYYNSHGQLVNIVQTYNE